MTESKKRNRAQHLEREMTVWDWSCRGKSERWIAREMGLSHTGIGLIIDRVEARLEKRFLKRAARRKVTQCGQLEHIVQEAMDAWERSKLPRKKAASRTVEGGEGDGAGEVTTSEIVERDGDCQYLYAAMAGMSNERSLLGLDVAPALQEASASVAELVKDMVARGSEFEKAEASEPRGSAEPVQADPGGVAEVPGEPGSVQRDHPLQGTPLESPA